MSLRSSAIGHVIFLPDEVGLGKTTEADIIMREVKLRARNGYDEVKNWSVGIKANLEVSHV